MLGAFAPQGVRGEPHGFLPSSGSSNLSIIPPVLTGIATPDERQPLLRVVILQ